MHTPLSDISVSVTYTSFCIFILYDIFIENRIVFDGLLLQRVLPKSVTVLLIFLIHFSKSQSICIYVSVF